jgi:hypothetical protein
MARVPGAIGPKLSVPLIYIITAHDVGYIALNQCYSLWLMRKLTFVGNVVRSWRQLPLYSKYLIRDHDFAD